MKNLENYGVLELSAKEIRETDGGGWMAKLLGAIVGALEWSARASTEYGINNWKHA